jgi:hypothetical protein
VDAVRHGVSANDSFDAMKIRPFGNRLGLGARRQAFPRLGPPVSADNCSTGADEVVDDQRRPSVDVADRASPQTSPFARCISTKADDGSRPSVRARARRRRSARLPHHLPREVEGAL